MVNLILPSSTVVIDRREKYPSIRKRLPLHDEVPECNHLFEYLQNEQLYKLMSKDHTIPMLTVDNGVDGPTAIDRILTSILDLIQMHYTSRVAISVASATTFTRNSIHYVTLLLL